MMKRLAVGLMTVGLVLGLASTSKALVFTYNFEFLATPWSTPPGIPSSNPVFSNFVAPVAFNPVTLFTPTELDYALDNQTPGLPSSSGTYTGSTVTFKYQLDNGFFIGGTAHEFLVTGTISGPVGNVGLVGFSSAAVTFTSMQDLTTGTFAIPSTDPLNLLPALEVITTIGGVPYQIWIDTRHSVPNPTQLNNIVTGYITSVPEPGVSALLLGSGVVGSLFAWRRRRAA